jgi:hypothetical protein
MVGRARNVDPAADALDAAAIATVAVAPEISRRRGKCAARAPVTNPTAPKTKASTIIPFAGGGTVCSEAVLCEGTVGSGTVSTRLALSLHPLGAAVLVVFGGPAASAFALLHGAGNGLLTISRGTLPLAMFGPAGCGLRTGIIAAPAPVTTVAAPLLFGLLLNVMGMGALVVSGGLSLAVLASLALLRVQPAEAAS